MCSVLITSVQGVEGPRGPGRLSIEGRAEGTPRVVLRVRSAGAWRSRELEVAPSGRWAALVEHPARRRAREGAEVEVRVEGDAPGCRHEWVGRVPPARSGYLGSAESPLDIRVTRRPEAREEADGAAACPTVRFAAPVVGPWLEPRRRVRLEAVVEKEHGPISARLVDEGSGAVLAAERSDSGRVVLRGDHAFAPGPHSVAVEVLAPCGCPRASHPFLIPGEPRARASAAPRAAGHDPRTHSEEDEMPDERDDRIQIVRTAEDDGRDRGAERPRRRASRDDGRDPGRERDREPVPRSAACPSVTFAPTRTERDGEGEARVCLEATVVLPTEETVVARLRDTRTEEVLATESSDDGRLTLRARRPFPPGRHTVAVEVLAPEGCARSATTFEVDAPEEARRDDRPDRRGAREERRRAADEGRRDRRLGEDREREGVGRWGDGNGRVRGRGWRGEEEDGRIVVEVDAPPGSRTWTADGLGDPPGDDGGGDAAADDRTVRVRVRTPDGSRRVFTRLAPRPEADDEGGREREAEREEDGEDAEEAEETEARREEEEADEEEERRGKGMGIAWAGVLALFLTVMAAETGFLASALALGIAGGAMAAALGLYFVAARLRGWAVWTFVGLGLWAVTAVLLIVFTSLVRFSPMLLAAALTAVGFAVAAVLAAFRAPPEPGREGRGRRARSGG